MSVTPYYGIDVQYMNNGYDDMFTDHMEYPTESSDADLDNPVM